VKYNFLEANIRFSTRPTELIGPQKSRDTCARDITVCVIAAKGASEREASINEEREL